ncbi:MAG: hypothetical protein IPL12_23225 [Bacteroidetes bacterium]|nr:hypothetical protein [Bacteroidota bacterium]
MGEHGFFTIVKGGDGSFSGHSDKFTLVDKSGNIRGFYKGTDSIQMQALVQDINYLVFKGEKMNEKLTNRIIVAISVAVPVLVAILFYTPALHLNIDGFLLAKISCNIKFSCCRFITYRIIFH